MTDIKFEKYVILYDFEGRWFYTENAVSAKDALIQFLDHTGNNKPLIRKALNGMENEVEMVELINAMTPEYIARVYKIDKVIYNCQAQ